VSYSNITLPMKILLVEDSPTDRQLMRYLLESRFDKEAKFREAASLAAAVAELDNGGIDCVILDLRLPDSVGKETFMKLVGRFPDVPIIVMTNNKDRELALEMIQLGAADYVLKNYTDEEDIFRRIVFAIEKHKRTVRVPPEGAGAIHKLERAQANMLTAHESGEHRAISNTTVETTTAIAELSRRMFAELQTLSTAQAQFKVSQDYIVKTVENLDKELLKGYSNRPSMRSQVDLLEHRLGETEQKMVDMQAARSHSQRSKDRLQQLQITNRTKVLLGILALVGTIATAIFTYEGVKHSAEVQKQHELQQKKHEPGHEAK